MAVINSTENGKHSSLEDIYCTEDLADKILHELTIFLVVDIFLSITALLGNTLILVALCKESSLHPPSKLLLRSLAATDLCVGLIAEPLHIMFELSMINKRWSICSFAVFASSITGYAFGGITLLTMTAISVDRLLALLLRLRYKQVVTLERMYKLVVAFWVVSIAAAVMFIWNFLVTLLYSYTVVSVCLVTSISCYIKIFYTLWRHQEQIYPDQPSQSSPLNTARYKNAVFNALWLQFALVICYLPYTIVGIVGAISPVSNPKELSSSVFVVKVFAIVLIFVNSSINPILYCWKIGSVRQAVKETVRQVLCYLSL